MKIVSGDGFFEFTNRGQNLGGMSLYFGLPLMTVLTIIAFVWTGQIGLVLLGVPLSLLIGALMPVLRIRCDADRVFFRNYLRSYQFSADSVKFRWIFNSLICNCDGKDHLVSATKGLIPRGRMGRKRDEITNSLRSLGHEVADGERGVRVADVAGKARDK